MTDIPIAPPDEQPPVSIEAAARAYDPPEVPAALESPESPESPDAPDEVLEPPRPGAHSAQDFDPPKCYPVRDKLLSVLDLLHRFTDKKWERNGMSRLADLHLKVGEPARFRLDGDLIPMDRAAPVTKEIVKQLLYPLLRSDQIEKLEREYPQDVDAAFHIEEDGGMNFRINAFHDRDGVACVIRSLPRTVPTMETLGFPDEEVLHSILHLSQGLVVITGITGSGKSTTISSLLSTLNRTENLRIITLEDPIEFVMKNEKCLVSQREVGLHTPTFHGGLRSALREDPDVILVGEIRDTETATLALTAAETGHLVFTTLHTRDTKGVVTRIVDLFPAERSKEVMSQLSFSLAYVIAQKLVPRSDTKGRVATYEVLKNVPAVGNLIRTGNWHQIYATIQLSARDHMISMEKHLMQLVARGIISRDTAVQYANDPSQMVFGPNGQPAPAPA